MHRDPEPGFAVKCPHCAKNMDYVQLEPTTARTGLHFVRAAIAYNCPWCKMLLSVQIDPLAIANEGNEQLLKALDTEPVSQSEP